jgi:hypothetical protein
MGHCGEHDSSKNEDGYKSQDKESDDHHLFVAQCDTHVGCFLSGAVRQVLPGKAARQGNNVMICAAPGGRFSAGRFFQIMLHLP